MKYDNRGVLYTEFSTLLHFELLVVKIKLQKIKITNN